MVNENGERLHESKAYELYVGFGQPDARSVQLTGQQPISLQWPTKPSRA